jgi:hypothetical protein
MLFLLCFGLGSAVDIKVVLSVEQLCVLFCESDNSMGIVVVVGIAVVVCKLQGVSTASTTCS